MDWTKKEIEYVLKKTSEGYNPGEIAGLMKDDLGIKDTK